MNSPVFPSQLLPEAWQCFHHGDLARAEELGQQALAANPRQAEVHNLLATVASQAGQLEVAITRMQQAVEAEPDNPNYRNNLGVFCITANRQPEAISCLRQVLQQWPQFADAHNNISYAYYKAGHYEEAQASAEQALRLRPGYAEANNHLGLALLELDRAEEAAAHFRAALKLQPGLVAVHRNLGSAHNQLGRLADATECLQEALRLAPDFAEAHSDLADVYKSQGRFAEAQVQLRQALRINPDYAFGWWCLSQFEAQGLCPLTDDDLSCVHALLESDRASLLDQSLLHLALACVHDHRGACDAAFYHFRQGNGQRQEWLVHSGRAFDPAAHQQVIDQIIETFDEEFFRQPHPGSSSSTLPVFVVGMPRSGTTLVEQILSSHSQVAGAGELKDLGRLVAALGKKGRHMGGYPRCMRFVEDADLRGVVDPYLARLTAVGGPAARIIDKMPSNFLYLGVIAQALPGARVIFCSRDPLDLCLSCYFQNFKEVDYSWSLEDLGHYHRQHRRLMDHWKRVLPLTILEVRYESLVAHQNAVSREMVAFCGLAWEDRCLAFHKNPRPVQTQSAMQVRQPMYSNAVGRWKKYARHLAPLRRALGLAESTMPPPPVAGRPAFPVTHGDDDRLHSE